MPHMTIAGHVSLVLWTQIAALLIAAHLLGALARRRGQPAVVGSLLAGLGLGPSVFGQLWPGGFHWFLPATGYEPRLLLAVSSASLLILLVVLGAETDLPLIRSLGRAAGAVTGGSILLPLIAGLVAGYVVPAELMGDSTGRTAFAVLLAGGLGASSLPVIARIVSELEMGRRNFGQLGIAAATLNDVFGFLMLALAAALVGGDGLSGLAVPLLGLVVIVGLLVLVGQRSIDAMLRLVRREGPNVAGSLAVCFVTVFAIAAATEALRVDAALGAFLAGMALGRSRFQQSQALKGLQDMTDALFAPLYFATAGLQVDLTTLMTPRIGYSFLALLGVAALTKYAGSFAGGVVARLTPRENSALAFMLNGRGAMQVIIGSAGLSLGIFSTGAYTIIILTAIVTTLTVAPLVRATVRGWAGTAEERERLDRERELEANVIVRGQRLLLPSRGSLNSLVAARVLDAAWPDSSELTVLSIGTDGQVPDVRPMLDLPSGREVRQQHVDENDVLDAILAEANLGYGVMALGAVESPSPERLLPETVEGLLSYSPIPVLVVRRARQAHESGLSLTGRFRRILTPVAGSSASRAGQEVAHTISRRTGATVTVLHVQTRPGGESTGAPTSEGGAGTVTEGAVTAVLVDALAVADEHDIAAEPMVRRGTAGEEIEAAVEEVRPDLVVIGATVRRVGGRPFLGHTVEHVLEHVDSATVVVVVMPEVAVTATGEGHADRSAR